jgi:uncharacterized protein (TIGR02265 family)
MLPRVSALEQALDRVSAHCDLRERLSLIPPSAKMRGMYFRSIEAPLMQAGKIEPYRALFPDRVPAIKWLPATEFLTRLAIGASLLTSPEGVHEGMYEIGRRNAASVSESLLGRTLIRLLSRDPRKVLQQGIAARRQSTSFGTWTLSFPSARSAVMTFREEYMYIESYGLGAAYGTFEAIDVPMKAEVELDNRFEGRHVLTW